MPKGIGPGSGHPVLPADYHRFMEMLPERKVPLGGVRGIEVFRTLPQRDLPTIGLWCFVDRFGPTSDPMKVLPHPHTGLQTVTWIQQGSIRHRDSLGSDVIVRPGHLDLMTGGEGVSHSEFPSDDDGDQETLRLQGVQLWTVLPEEHRNSAAAFQSLTELPSVAGEGYTASVMVGTFRGAVSPATTYGPMIGLSVDVEESATIEIPLDTTFEHGVLVTNGSLEILDDGPVKLPVGPLGYLTPGPSVLKARTLKPTTFLLLGGVPFTEEIVMWWNFIGRTHDEIVAMRDAWEDLDSAHERYGSVAGHHGRRIPAPPMPPVRLKPRRRRASRDSASGS